MIYFKVLTQHLCGVNQCFPLLQMEQVRRVNRLWASDSLFLQQTLMIPAPRPEVSDRVLDDESVHSPSSLSNSDNEERSISDFLVKIDASIANTKAQVKESVGNSE